MQSLRSIKNSSFASAVDFPPLLRNLCIGAPGLGGLANFLEWIFRNQSSMHPRTAFEFLLFSVALYLIPKGRGHAKNEKLYKGAIFLLALVGLIAIEPFIEALCISLSESLGSSSKILLLNEFGKSSPISSSCFLLVVSILILRIFGKSSRASILSADLLTLGGLVVSVVLGFAYSLGIDHFYLYNPATNIDILSLVFFFCIFFALVFFNPQAGFARFILSPLAGSHAARRLFPSILLTGLGLSWVRWKAQQAGLFGTEIGIIFSLTAFVVCMSYVLWICLNSLNFAEHEKKILQTERDRLYELPNHLLCVLDENLCFRSVNVGFTEVLGYQAQEMIGRSIWDFVHPEDRSKSAEMEMRGHRIVIHSFENRYRTKNGDYRWLRWTGTVLEGMNYGAAIDVTAEKEKEAELKNAFTSMQQLTFRLHQAQEEERSRISREIHDELGQSLAVLKMEMYSFKKQFAEDTTAGKGFVQMLESIDGLVRSVRNVVADLRPTALEDFGLGPAIDWWLEGVLQRTGLNVTWHSNCLEGMLTREQETAIFRILQEAVTNAIRHSKSEKIEIRLENIDEILNLTVRDFGLGLSENAMGKVTSTGVLGMKERLCPFFGDVEISNAAGGGVQVFVRMPLREGVRL